MRRASIALVFAGVLLAGCGRSGGGSRTTAPSPGFNIALTPPASVATLGTQVTIPVALYSTGGFAGTVALSASGVPASWGAAFTPSASVDLGSGGGGATLILTIPSDGAAAPAGVPITVEGAASTGNRNDVATVTVADQYVIPIAPGAGTGAHFGALAGQTLYLPVGATVVFRNDDSSDHLIHTSATIPGLPPESAGSPLGPGQSYSSGILGAGTDAGIYCQLHGTPTGAFTIVVH